MTNYYNEKLSAQKLFKVYDTQIQRVSQYLQAEIDFVKRDLSGAQNVLELGSGYGRIIKELAPYCKSITGIDISEESVELGREYLSEFHNTGISVMDVHSMRLSGSFDVILCLQNGLSAMHIDSDAIQNILNMLAHGGTAYFSSYSSRFWDIRLKWFEEQASKGLLGEIDYTKTQNGTIICKDGFKAVTYSPENLKAIGDESGYPYKVQEIDDSSIFLTIHKPLK